LGAGLKTGGMGEFLGDGDGWKDAGDPDRKKTRTTGY